MNKQGRLRQCGMPVLLAVMFLTLTAAAADTVRYSDIKALQGVLPQKSAYYNIDETVEVQDPYYVFKISSPHHPLYTVTGISELIKTCHEISMMEWFYTTETGSQVWHGVKDSVKNTAAGAKQLVIHPGDSFQGMKRSIKRTGRSIKDMVKGIGKDKKSSDGRNLEEGAGNFLTSDVARKAAYELHLDAYTQNTYVRSLLNNIALRRSAGGAAVSVATSIVVPMSTIVSVSSSFAINGALTPGAYLEGIEVLLRDNPPGELYRELAKHLLALGIPDNSKEMLLFKEFLANTNYTPHDKAYMTSFIVKLGKVRGAAEVLQTLATTASTANANVFYNQMQFLSSFNGKMFNLAAFAVNEQNIFGVTGDQQVIAIYPYDCLMSSKDWKDDMAFLRSVPGSKRSMWLLGSTSPEFKQFLQKSGVNELRENILHYGQAQVKAQ